MWMFLSLVPQHGLQSVQLCLVLLPGVTENAPKAQWSLDQAWVTWIDTNVPKAPPLFAQNRTIASDTSLLWIYATCSPLSTMEFYAFCNLCALLLMKSPKKYWNKFWSSMLSNLLPSCTKLICKWKEYFPCLSKGKVPLLTKYFLVLF